MDDRLKHAVGIARSGQREQARGIVADLLRESQSDFRAWVVMSQLVENPEQEVDCLRRADRLRPNMAPLQKMLAEAEARLARDIATPAGTPFETAYPYDDDLADTKPVAREEIAIPPYAEETQRSALFETRAMPPESHSAVTLPSQGTTALDREEFQRILAASDEEEVRQKNGGFLSFLHPGKK